MGRRRGGETAAVAKSADVRVEGAGDGARRKIVIDTLVSRQNRLIYGYLAILGLRFRTVIAQIEDVSVLAPPSRRRGKRGPDGEEGVGKTSTGHLVLVNVFVVGAIGIVAAAAANVYFAIVAVVVECAFQNLPIVCVAQRWQYH